ncbi:hypothetical protein VT85_00950 [Planctomyces sp. SH-PL62]|nr:hypothetical protein VT85_00950 [Planctomyces sp. SH-PL62]
MTRKLGLATLAAILCAGASAAPPRRPPSTRCDVPPA